MSGDDDKRTFFQVDIDFLRGWVLIDGRVGFVQFFHDFDCHLTGAHGKADQFLDRQPVVREGFQGENIEIIRLIAVIAELSRLMPVGADAFESVENGLTQGPDVRIERLVIHDTGDGRVAQHLGFGLRKIVGGVKRGLTGSACVSPEFFFDALGFAQKFDMYFRVKINVRKCGKQHLFDEADNTFIHRSAFFDQRLGIAADALDLKD